MQMARFIGGERFITIQWLEKKQTEADLVKPNVFRRVIAPFAVIGVIIWRSVGLSNVLDMLEALVAGKAQLSDTIVPFNEGKAAFEESTGYYLLRGLYTSIVSILGSFNLLI